MTTEPYRQSLAVKLAEAHDLLRQARDLMHDGPPNTGDAETAALVERINAKLGEYVPGLHGPAVAPRPAGPPMWDGS